MVFLIFFSSTFYHTYTFIFYIRLNTTKHLISTIRKERTPFSIALLLKVKWLIKRKKGRKTSLFAHILLFFAEVRITFLFRMTSFIFASFTRQGFLFKSRCLFSTLSMKPFMKTMLQVVWGLKKTFASCQMKTAKSTWRMRI